MNDDSTNWTELREFKGVLLTDSYVLSWHCEGHDLVVDLDLCLGPAHPFYERPRRAEGACIRPALLQFPECTELTGSDKAESLEDAASRMAHGRISAFRRVADGRYELGGEFGRAVIVSDRPLLRLGDRLP